MAVGGLSLMKVNGEPLGGFAGVHVWPTAGVGRLQPATPPVPGLMKSIKRLGNPGTTSKLMKGSEANIMPTGSDAVARSSSVFCPFSPLNEPVPADKVNIWARNGLASLFQSITVGVTVIVPVKLKLPESGEAKALPAMPPSTRTAQRNVFRDIPLSFLRRCIGWPLQAFRMHHSYTSTSSVHQKALRLSQFFGLCYGREYWYLGLGQWSALKRARHRGIERNRRRLRVWYISPRGQNSGWIERLFDVPQQVRVGA